MPSKPPSSIMTLQDLIEHLQADTELPASKVRNVASSIRTFAKAVGCTLQAEASFPLFRRRIKDVNPRGHGITERHWSNVKSNLTFALRRYGAPTRAALRKDLSERWAVLRDAVDGEPRLLRGLSGLMHWASGASIEPDEISDSVLERYLDHLRHQTLQKVPEKRHRDVVQLWNQAARCVQSWPDASLTVPDRRRLIRISWDEFPRSYRDDVDDYESFMAGDSLLARHAPSVPRRKTTLDNHRKQIQRLASALVRSGFPIEQLTDLSVLIDRSNFEAALQWYADWLGDAKAPSLRELLGTMIVLAREYLRVEEARVQEIKVILDRIPRRPRGMTEKNRERLRPLLDPQNQHRFLHLADRLLQLAGRLGSKRAALLVQRALAHELLLVAPMRFGNLVRLGLNRHFRFVGKGSHRRVLIVIAPGEVKNAQLLEFELPPHVISLLDLYLDKHRPLLLDGADQGWLFPGRDGGHKHEVGLREQLCKAVAEHAGLTVNPHLYRHIAAFFYLLAHPGEYETVRRLLAHASVDTTIAFYAEFEGLAARRLYTDHLLERRAEGIRGPGRL